MPVSRPLFADPEPTPNPSSDSSAPMIKLGGLLDSYYSYNFTNTNPGSGNVGTFFNHQDNSFNLGLAEATLSITQGEAGGHLALVYGQESALGLGSGPGIDVLQAYVSYDPGEWSFNAGRLESWMGVEVVESNQDWNYSRSLLYWYTIPHWYDGLDIGWTASDGGVGIIGYALEGWDNPTGVTPAHGEKTFGLQVNLKPDTTWNVTFNGIIGPHPYSFTDSNLGYVGEGILTFNATDNLFFALDAEYGGQNWGSYPMYLVNGSTVSSSSFWGAAFYARYKFDHAWALALRLEEVEDGDDLLEYWLAPLDNANNSATANDVEAREATLTLDHKFSRNLLFRLEGRYDMALSGGQAVKAFNVINGVPNSANQFTATASAVMSF